MTVQDAVAMVVELDDTGADMELADVQARVRSLGTMDATSLRALVVELCGAALGRSRAAMVGQLERRTLTMRADTLRLRRMSETCFNVR